MELSNLKTFLTVARKGNLSAAARELGATQPNLGRQMTALSKEVCMELFVRHSRGIELTKQGKEFSELCQNIVGQLEQGTAIIREKDSEPEGTLRFITGTGSLETILDNIPIFSKKYPKLCISFPSEINVLTPNAFDLQVGNVDAMHCPFTFSNPDLIQHHLHDMLLKIYASPSYLQSHTKPLNLQDLKNHRLVAYIGENQDLLNKQLIDEKTKTFYQQPFLEVHSGLSMRLALLKGLGIGCYGYDREMLENGLLFDVFPEMPELKIPYYFTYHKRLEGSPKIMAFHEFMKEVVKIWQKQP